MTELALPLTLVGGMLCQTALLTWWLRGRLDRMATVAELAWLRHRVANMGVIVEFLAREHPELQPRVVEMIAAAPQGKGS